MKYIGQQHVKECIFCKILRQKKDKKNLIILRSRYCFAVFNRFPYNNGHIMIVVNRHVRSPEQLKEQEILDMHRTLIKIHFISKRILKPSGFNIGINIGKFAGAGVDKHLHIHIVPRWVGDTNFMPVLAQTKIISQGLQDLYEKFKKAL
jgi:ATP adenylyltransferase